MFDFLRTAVLAAAVGIGAALTAPAAEAGDVRIGFSFSDGVVDVRSDRRRGGRRGYRGDRFYDDYRFERRGRCRPRRALRKAYRMGLDRPYIHRIGRRGVIVKGVRYGRRATVGFGRARHCPVRFARRG